jgi:UDP-N-acetylglucosamine 3-dehydrogenase
VSAAAPLRVALIGAGRMGGHHARVLGSVAGAHLVGVHDTHSERAVALAAQHGCPVLGGLDEVAATCDAAIVATSSLSHRTVGRALLDAGVACLIEKPLATTEADCLELIATAARRGVVLAVGHVERFNPATVALLGAIQGWQVRAIETRRLNPAGGRIIDTGVVSDLMVHDLEIVLRVMGRPPIDVVAAGITYDPDAGADHAMAVLSFDGSALASCAASRITAHRARELTLMGDRGTVVVDYLARSVQLLAPGAAPAPIPVGDTDALATELGGFVDTVRAAGPRRGHVVAGAEALAALRIAWAIERQIARQPAGI